ncbi:uncharacterized protein LOC129596465 [Paramacrobiotus metropolitanus]|uniref:uncharacterized protein LOC129596465 n=1 Tax=Paramacrobiotus metropolitanus TaxID=2943436 RepID=UPI002446123C|nr:uncharacterized protein LOC129596465 [Paramacrobiotus metropolitanus]
MLTGMDTENVIFIILGLGLLYCAGGADAQYYNSYPDLENTCNQSLTIECPYPYTGRAGTFRYYFIPNMPMGLCTFNVTLAADCGGPYDRFAFYFNVRKFILPTADYVRIYQTAGSLRFLLKELTGRYTAWYFPSSVAQALTSYAKQPSITFEYFRGSALSTGSHEAYIDFVVVENDSHSMNTRCTALSGYVNNNFICHTDGTNERVNCPASFTPIVNGMNPAYSRQCAPQTTTTYPYYWYSSTPSYWNSHSNYDYGLSSGAITGIVMGSVFFVVFLIAVASAACSASRKTSPSRPILALTSGNINTSRPVVVGQPAFAVEPTPPFMGAPPSYGEVTALPAQKATASPAQVSVPMPQPPIPKF